MNILIYSRKKSNIYGRQADLRQAEDEVDEKQKNASDRFINIVKKYTYLNELDANIHNELIDRIVVHHKERTKAAGHTSR